MRPEFKAGDRVTIARNAHRDVIEDGEFLYLYFDKYVGRHTTLVESNGLNEDGVACWLTDIDFNSRHKLSVCELDIELTEPTTEEAWYNSVVR